MSFKPKVFARKDKARQKVVVFAGLCKGCGLCIEKCPQKAITFSPKVLGIYSMPTVTIDMEKCNLCGICELVCPDSAIRVDRKGSDA